MRMFNRRTALTGAVASTTALALPAAAATEHPEDRVYRLARELGTALADPAYKGFRTAVVKPGSVYFQDDDPVPIRRPDHWSALAGEMDQASGNRPWLVTCGRYPTGELWRRCVRIEIVEEPITALNLGTRREEPLINRQTGRPLVTRRERHLKISMTRGSATWL